MDSLDNLYKIIRRNIKSIRKEKRLTQKELAEKIGVSEGYISDIERINKNKHPSILCLINISKALNVEIIDLIESREEVWRIKRN